MGKTRRFGGIHYWRPGLLATVLTLAVHLTVAADVATYEQEFVREVAEFASHNRLHISRLHRDVHANCFIEITLATVILEDGSVKDISIVTSSSVPVVDRYYRFVIEQAAPYPPLKDHFDPVPVEVTITHKFRLDVRLSNDRLRSDRPCKRLKEFDPDEL